MTTTRTRTRWACADCDARDEGLDAGALDKAAEKHGRAEGHSTVVMTSPVAKGGTG
jgi:hypothetical protein